MHYAMRVRCASGAQVAAGLVPCPELKSHRLAAHCMHLCTPAQLALSQAWQRGWLAGRRGH